MRFLMSSIFCSCAAIRPTRPTWAEPSKWLPVCPFCSLYCYCVACLILTVCFLGCNSSLWLMIVHLCLVSVATLVPVQAMPFPWSEPDSLCWCKRACACFLAVFVCLVLSALPCMTCHLPLDQGDCFLHFKASVLSSFCIWFQALGSCTFEGSGSSWWSISTLLGVLVFLKRSNASCLLSWESSRSCRVLIFQLLSGAKFFF